MVSYLYPRKVVLNKRHYLTQVGMMVPTKFGFRHKKTTNNLEVGLYVVYHDSIFIISRYRLARGLATCAQTSLT